MNSYNRRQQVFVVVVVVVLFSIFASFIGNAGADGPGKSTEPLPSQSKACDGPAADKNPHCSQPKPTQVNTPVPPQPTAQPTQVKVQPTSVPPTKVKVNPTQVRSAEPTVIPSPTAQPSATATPILTACGDAEVCSPCEFLEDALADGMMVIIIDQDKVEVYEDMSIRIPGQFDLLATGLLSESGYGN